LDILWVIVIILVVLWLLGYSMGLGTIVHILLIIVVIVVLVRLLQGKKIF